MTSPRHPRRLRSWIVIVGACVLVSAGLTSCSPSGGGLAPESSSTVTGSATDSSDIIAVIGDFGSGDENERAVADLIAARNADAVVTTGDNVYSNAGYATLVGDFYGPFVATGTFYPATGNHDYEQGIAAFDDYFGYLKGQRDYTVTLGDTEFFILDGDQGLASLDANHNQEAWLRNVVGASIATYKIVVVHYPPYSSGDRHGSTSDYQWDFAGMGVTLVLSGHDHLYERIESGGVTYVVNGAGGKTLYACGDRVSGSALCFDANFGALFLSSTPEGLGGEFVEADSTVVDGFTIPTTR